MVPSVSAHKPARGLAARIGVLLAGVVIVALALAPVVEAAVLTNAWQAKLGTSGANGTAKIQAFSNGSGSVTLKLAKFRASTLLPVVLHKGTCGSTGAVLVRWASIKTTSKGVASRTSSLTTAQVSLVKKATAGTGKIAIRVGSAATGGVKCGLLAVLVVPPSVPKVTARIPVGSVPSDIAVGAGGVWVTDLVGNALFRIDPATNQVAGPLALGVPSAGMPMAVAASGDAVWVAGNTLPLPGDGMVLRVDPTSKSVVATIPVGSGALDIAAGAGAVWVISARDGTVSRIDPATNSVTATVHVGVNPGGIGVGAGAVWVADYLGAALVRLDQTTGQVVATVKLAGPARKVSVAPDAVWVIVADAWGAIGTLVRVDPKTNAIVASIPLNADPWGVAATASAVWVAAKGVSDAIWVNPATNTIGGRVPLGGDSIGVDVSGSTAWLVGQTPAEVVRIDFSGVTQGPPAATPPVTATPSPAPSPTASPSVGGTMYMGPYFALAVPAGWSPSSDGQPSFATVVFAGPGEQRLLANSGATTLTLDDLVAQVIAAVKNVNGVDPEQDEAITMAGVPGRLLAYHFVMNGVNRYEIDAFCVSNGRGYELSFVNTAGTETADRALFLGVLATFEFGAGF